MKSIKNWMVGIMCVLAGSSVLANDELSNIKAALIKQYPEAKDATVTKAPIDGLYQVADGAQIMYVSKDMKYLFNGDIYDLNTRKNITDNQKNGLRVKEMNAMGEDNMLIFMPAGEVKHTITVFTDTHCPYCRKFHSEIEAYLNSGIKVRYVFMPFKGESSYNDSVSIWCAKNRQEAFTAINNGNSVAEISCTNPIAQHQALAAEIGVLGTPAIVLANGALLPGYVPAKNLVAQLYAQNQ